MRPLLHLIVPSSLLGVLSICALTVALADQDNTKRLAEFAKLPNWNGVWQAAPISSATAANDPVLNPAWLQKRSNKKTAPTVADNSQARCVWGMPRLLRTLHSFEITVLPEQSFFSYDINEFRHVWTDGRKQSQHLSPTNTGYSIGHWEGNTLVIDTMGIQSGLWITNKAVTLSPKATVQERWTQTDNDHLKVDVSVHDPLALSKPFAFSRRYDRSDATHFVQKQCFDEPHDAVSKDSSG